MRCSQSRTLAVAFVFALSLVGCGRDWTIFEPREASVEQDAGDADIAHDADLTDIGPDAELPIDVPAPLDAPGCGTVGQFCCPTAALCEMGLLCTPSMRCESCAAPMSVCGAACVNLQTDDVNCGACNVRCTGGRTCMMGVCNR